MKNPIEKLLTEADGEQALLAALVARSAQEWGGFPASTMETIIRRRMVAPHEELAAYENAVKQEK